MKFPLSSEELSKFKYIIKTHSIFFLTVHQNPDADAVGSMIATYIYLKKLGKKVYMFSSDPIPENLKILKYSNLIKNSLDKKEFDVGIFFECSTISRAGEKLNELKFKKIINIDHHKTAQKFGDVNILNFSISSTSEIMWFIFKYLKHRINKYQAECLYSGIVTDTGKFHYSQTTSQTHRIAAELLDLKIPFSKLNDNFFMTKSFGNLKLLGRALESMTIKENEIAVMQLIQKDFKDFNAKFQDSENIINYGLMLKNVKVSVLIKEDKDKFHVTFRSKGNIDVSKIASYFGGGGHKNASGCKISKAKYRESEKIINAIINLLKNKNEA